MKLFELFDDDNQEEFDPKVVAELIKISCGQFLSNNLENMRRGAFLYRGDPNHDAEFIDVTVEGRRTPRDTPLRTHIAVDQATKDTLGWRYRSHAVFVTPNIDATHQYIVRTGSVYVIFPKDDYTIAYSPLIDDMTNDIDRIMYSHFRNNYDNIIEKAKQAQIQSTDPHSPPMMFMDLQQHWLLPENYDFFRDYIYPCLQYTTTKVITDLTQERNSEGMVKCNSYYGISVGKQKSRAQYTNIREVLRLL